MSNLIRDEKYEIVKFHDLKRGDVVYAESYRESASILVIARKTGRNVVCLRATFLRNNKIKHEVYTLDWREETGKGVLLVSSSIDNGFGFERMTFYIINPGR